MLSPSAPTNPRPDTDPGALPSLPVSRIDGRWHLAVGLGHVSIEDDALTRDLEALASLLAPATSPGRRP
ncbi:hypothetical protein [Streptacidiphilus sp. MAP12-33]|uniref:hypothetical protein n=1 Tax=Streptacidiphilus sp. MAP12-33 TaxID=3156266 RepID=UPI0035157DA6